MLKKQLGFVMPVMGYIYILVALAFLGMGVALRVQTARLDSCKTEHALFVAQVKVVGDAQEAKTKLQITKDIQSQEKANAENATTLAALRGANRRLRDLRPSGSFVPAAPAGTSRPDLLCFDRAEYQRTDGEFTDEARGLALEGSESTVNLDSGKRWAQSP